MSEILWSIRTYEILFLDAGIFLLLILAFLILWRSIAMRRRMDKVLIRVEDYLNYLEEAGANEECCVEKSNPVCRQDEIGKRAEHKQEIIGERMRDKERSGLIIRERMGDEEQSGLIRGVLEEIFP